MASVTVLLVDSSLRTRLERCAVAYCLGVTPVHDLKIRWKCDGLMPVASAKAFTSGELSKLSMSLHAFEIAAARCSSIEAAFARHRLHARKPARSASLTVR